MMGGGVFFHDLAYVFGAALLGGLVARLLRQPLILGYVAGGMLIGPFTPGPTVSDIHAFESMAEIGVILLMYSVGIEFTPRDLVPVKWLALIGGPLGILLSMALCVGVGWLFGLSTATGIAMGAIISVASTMVLAKLLLDAGQVQSEHGRAMIGITLVEDFAVVILTVLRPSLTTLSRENLLAAALSIAKALLIIAPVIFLAARLVPGLLARIARTENQELFVLVAVALGFATAAVTEAVGLSLALGAFLAGIIVSGSDYAHRTLAQLLPLRDVFVALLFVTIGALVDPKVLFQRPILLVVLLALIIFGKLAVWTLVALLFRYPLRTALLIAVGLTQIGEFSYVLVQVARDARLVDAALYNATLMASLISIFLNVVLVRYAAPRLQGTRRAAHAS